MSRHNDQFDLVLFDCDGVLVDSEPLVNRAYVDLLAVEGYALNEAETLREFAGAKFETRVAAFSLRLGWAPDDLFEITYRKYLDDLFRSYLKPIPGMHAALEQIRVATCVASNGSIEEVAFRLSLTGLTKYFEDGTLFGAGATLRPKPFPDVFLHAANSMGFDPARCVVIEDSVRGVEAALAAGMTVLGYAGSGGARELQSAGAATFNGMDELPPLLNSLS